MEVYFHKKFEKDLKKIKEKKQKLQKLYLTLKFQLKILKKKMICKKYQKLQNSLDIIIYLELELVIIE